MAIVGIRAGNLSKTSTSRWWRRVTSVAWVQHRSVFVSVTVLTIGFILALILTGRSVHATYAAYVRLGCLSVHPGDLSACVTGESALSADQSTQNLFLITIRSYPLLIGMFVGAPLLAREFESGTFRFAWTQGIGKYRWLIGMILVLGVFVVCSAFVLSMAVTWWSAPLNDIGLTSRWQSGQFDLTQLTLPAWTLLALALGTSVGALMRRVIPAMASAGAMIIGILTANYVWLNHEMLSLGEETYRVSVSKVTSVAVGTLNTFAFPARNLAGPRNSWLVSGWLSSGTLPHLSTAAAHRVLLEAATASQGRLKSNGIAQWLSQHHYVYHIGYQSSDRYWFFQLLEWGTILAISALLFLVAIAVLRRPTPIGPLSMLSRAVRRDARDC